jgi:hypothetical protein
LDEVSLQGTPGKKKKAATKPEQKDWTEPKHLDSFDHDRLKKIKNLCDTGDYAEAMDLASRSDTVIREEIPPNIWQKMGGKLTPTGEEKLRKLKRQGLAGRSDSLNPEFIFNMTETQLLVEALRGDFDITHSLKKELAKRGVDKNGLWVGFKQAAKTHGVK